MPAVARQRQAASRTAFSAAAAAKPACSGNTGRVPVSDGASRLEPAVAQAGYKPATAPSPVGSPPGRGFVAESLREVYEREEIEPLLARPQAPRTTTSKLLPKILRLRSKGLSYCKIGQRLELPARQVEHVLSRYRKHSGQ